MGQSDFQAALVDVLCAVKNGSGSLSVAGRLWESRRIVLGDWAPSRKNVEENNVHSQKRVRNDLLVGSVCSLLQESEKFSVHLQTAELLNQLRFVKIPFSCG